MKEWGYSAGSIKTDQVMVTRTLYAGFAGLGLFFSVALGAQERAVPPTDVAVAADGAAAVVTWTPVPMDGVMYRVARTLDLRRSPVDITTEPVAESKVVDARIQAGVTYYYQVIAVYRDATTAPAAFVSFTAPAATVATSEPLTVVTAIAPATLVLPTAVTGVVVEGNTTASALVSWQAVPGATSYSVKRSYGSSSATPVSGLTTTSWTDLGPSGVGFTTAGTYTYDVTATMATGPALFGQATWKRPAPVCDEPAATLQPLTVLDPAALVAIQSPNPAGPVLWWHTGWSRLGVPVALRIDRMVQGGKAWTVTATSCDGTIPPSGYDVTIFDQIKGVSPATTYVYKLTALAASGDIGVGTVSWTSPNPSVMHWLSATSAGSTVTMNFRYEPPATNAANVSQVVYHVTAPYGFDQSLGRGVDCGKIAGCSMVATGVPSGTHVFTVSAEWKMSNKVVYRISSPTTVVVP